MDIEDIREALQEIFRQVFDTDILLSDDLTPSVVDGWDSLAHVTLIFAVEKRFGVKFTGNEIANAECVGDFIELVTAKTRCPAPSNA